MLLLGGGIVVVVAFAAVVVVDVVRPGLFYLRLLVVGVLFCFVCVFD